MEGMMCISIVVQMIVLQLCLILMFVFEGQLVVDQLYNCVNGLLVSFFDFIFLEMELVVVSGDDVFFIFEVFVEDEVEEVLLLSIGYNVFSEFVIEELSGVFVFGGVKL